MRNFKSQNEECCLNLSEKSGFEKLEEYRDELPFLGFRKGLTKFKLWVSYVCLIIISNPLFEAVSLCVIVTNSIFLAFERFDGGETPAFVEQSEVYFLILYTIEMFLNIFGMGFIWNRNSYLRDPWYSLKPLF